MLSPLISSVPTSPGGRSRPSSSTIRASKPGTIWPVLPGSGLARPVGDEDVQDLGRADAVEDLHAEPLAPAEEEVPGQGLAGRNAHPHVAQARAARSSRPRAAGPRSWSARCRRPWAGSGRWSAKTLLRHGPLGQQHGRAAGPQGEIQAVAQPVGEEQLRHRERHVRFAQADRLRA